MLLGVKLLTAHLAGDYLVQTDRMAREKRRPRVLALHMLVHAALVGLVVLTEPCRPALIVVAAIVLGSHAAIDAWTSRIEPRGLRVLVLDQSLHVLAIGAALAAAGGPWIPPGLSGAAFAPRPWLVVCGAIVAVPAGATFNGRWIRPFREALSNESRAQQQGLERAGWWIGILERMLVYVAILAGIESLVGFVIAVKAVLRLPEAREKWSRELAEYYLVGSLASLAWALTCALAVRGILRRLPGAG